MTLNDARKIILEMDDGYEYKHIESRDSVCLDGHFSPSDLRRIAEIMDKIIAESTEREKP